MALRGHLGGSWEQQDGPEAADNRIFTDLGKVLKHDYVSVLGSKCLFFCLVPGLFPDHLGIDSDSKFQRLGFLNCGFRM